MDYVYRTLPVCFIFCGGKEDLQLKGVGQNVTGDVLNEGEQVTVLGCVYQL